MLYSEWKKIINQLNEQIKNDLYFNVTLSYLLVNKNVQP